VNQGGIEIGALEDGELAALGIDAEEVNLGDAPLGQDVAQPRRRHRDDRLGAAIFGDRALAPRRVVGAIGCRHPAQHFGGAADLDEIDGAGLRRDAALEALGAPGAAQALEDRRVGLEAEAAPAPRALEENGVAELLAVMGADIDEDAAGKAAEDGAVEEGVLAELAGIGDGHDAHNIRNPATRAGPYGAKVRCFIFGSSNVRAKKLCPYSPIWPVMYITGPSGWRARARDRRHRRPRR